VGVLSTLHARRPLPAKNSRTPCVVISEQERAASTFCHGDFHVDEDLAAAPGITIRCNAGRFRRRSSSTEETTRPGFTIARHFAQRIYTGWRWPHVVDKIEHRPRLSKLWRLAQGKPQASNSALLLASYGFPGHSHA